MSFILDENLVTGHNRAHEVLSMVSATRHLRYHLSLPKPADMTPERYGQRQALIQLAAQIIEADIPQAVQTMLGAYITDAIKLSQVQRQGLDSLILDRIEIIQQKQSDDDLISFGELRRWFKKS